MIHREHRGPVLLLRMDHGKANALDTVLAAELEAAFHEAASEPARAVVLTGTGRIFSAGVDLFRLLDGGPAYSEQFLPLFSRVLLQLFRFPRPVVAAINGHAIAGGFILACACDHRVMARDAGLVGIPELLVGLPFPVAALEVGRSAIPEQDLRELVYFGHKLTSAEASERRIVDECVAAADLVDRALAVAGTLAAIPAASFARTKRALRQPTLDRIDALRPSADPETAAIWAAPESADAIRRYLAQTLGRSR